MKYEKTKGSGLSHAISRWKGLKQFIIHNS